MAALSKLEMLPVEIMHSILSYLVHPRSRLPGLTEYQSTRECPEAEKKAAKDAYQLNPTVSPDVDRYAVDLFSIGELHHPINDLASTSKHLRDRTEQYCAHLVKKCSTLNLYFSQADSNDLQAVNPDLSAGIYRRLWLRHGPRYCTYCNALLDSKNERATRTFIEACEDCFYAQVYTLGEVEKHFHISRVDLAAYQIHLISTWVLKVDIEGLAIELYGTKAFHEIQAQRPHTQPCPICIRSGTLARIMRLRAQRLTHVRQPIPHTNGWLLTPRPDNSSQGPRPSYRWPKLLRYHNDNYLYEDEEVDVGYNLRSRDLLDGPSGPASPNPGLAPRVS